MGITVILATYRILQRVKMSCVAVWLVKVQEIQEGKWYCRVEI